MGWEGLLAGKREAQRAHSLSPAALLQMLDWVLLGGEGTGLLTPFFPSRAFMGSLLPRDQSPSCWPNVQASRSGPYLTAASSDPVYVTP